MRFLLWILSALTVEHSPCVRGNPAAPLSRSAMSHRVHRRRPPSNIRPPAALAVGCVAATGTACRPPQWSTTPRLQSGFLQNSCLAGEGNSSSDPDSGSQLRHGVQSETLLQAVSSPCAAFVRTGGPHCLSCLCRCFPAWKLSSQPPNTLAPPIAKF